MFDTLPVSEVWPFKHPPFFFPLVHKCKLKNMGNKTMSLTKKSLSFPCSSFLPSQCSLVQEMGASQTFGLPKNNCL